MIDDISVSEASVSAECSRAQIRRNQILDAAAHCFRAYGFHGASIAKISQQAGMSVGHIYHYFENKEAIIAAIVQRDLDRLVEIWAELRASHYLHETIIKLSADGVKDTMDNFLAGLRLEIVTEAARNPEVAHIVQAADGSCMESLIEILRFARQAGGKDDDEETLAVMAEIIASIFEGLMVRAIRNPTINRERITIMVQRVISRIITSPDWSGMVQAY
ncbi:MAG: TetR/AcrR family transcriptional regulator [Betaproteobacteria bacterium]|nr:TetR/AcrR family transcriptional regulator [Betaproteobacteria bacterium]